MAQGEEIEMCEIIRNAPLVVVWSLKEGYSNALTGYETIAGNALYCTQHGQDATFCAIAHEPQTWQAFLLRTRSARIEYP